MLKAGGYEVVMKEWDPTYDCMLRQEAGVS